MGLLLVVFSCPSEPFHQSHFVPSTKSLSMITQTMRSDLIWGWAALYLIAWSPSLKIRHFCFCFLAS